MLDTLFFPFHVINWFVTSAVFAIVLGVKLFALIDAAIRPSAAYQRAGLSWSKKVWLIVLALAVLFGGIGILGLVALVAAIVYLVDARPKLREVGGRGNNRSVGPYGGW